MTDVVPRGIRNNNPGNIDYHPSEDPWRGLADPPTDGRFCRFETPVWGIRALAKTLITYQWVHKCRTVRSIINRWAPPAENDTGEYVRHVAQLVGVGPDAPIDVTRVGVMAPLVRAIITHENGQQPYSTATIQAALSAAGVTA